MFDIYIDILCHNNPNDTLKTSMKVNYSNYVVTKGIKQIKTTLYFILFYKSHHY